ncbi:MAG TPA: phage tail tape measure protein, partial [Anaerolineales bacterium]|nr:phage tail tape measure protein [Anaerolineales bacterium]
MPVELGSAHGKIIIDFSGIMAGVNQGVAALNRFGDAAKSIGSRMSSIGDQLTRSLTLPIVGAGVAAGRMALDFEASMQQVVGLVGVSQRQVDAWGKQLLTLGPQLGRAPKELADAMYFVTSAGIKGGAALDVVTASAKAASAGLGQTQIIADAVTSALVAYGAENLSAGKAVGILVAAVREGKAEASDIAPALGRVIPIASQLGIRFDEVGAAMAAMTRVGFDAAESATNLSGIMAAVLKPSKQAADVLAQFGLSGEELRKTIKERGLLAVLTLLKDTIGQDDEALAKIFPNIRGFRGLLSLVGENAESTRQVFKSLAGATEEDLNRAFEVASQTAKFKFGQAMAEVQSSLITFGQAVLPVVIPLLQSLAKTISDVAKWFADLPEPVKQTVVQVLALVAALGPVLAIGGRLVSTVGILANMISGLAGGFFKAAGAVGGFLKTGGQVVSYIMESGVVTGALVAQLGLLAAGLVVVAKFIEAAGKAAHATNEELVAMAHSGDLFEQAGASFEVVANGSKRLRDVFIQHQEDMKKALLKGTVTLEEYNAEIERSAKAAGVWTEMQSLGGQVTVKVDSAVQKLTKSQLENMRISAEEAGRWDEGTRFAHRFMGAVQDGTVALDEGTDAMDEATRQANEYAEAQKELIASQERANAEFERLQFLMAGPVGEEIKNFNQKQDELKTKAAELQQTISTSYGKARDDAIIALAGVNTALGENAAAHDDALKRILFDIAVQQLAVDGLTADEAGALNQLTL